MSVGRSRKDLIKLNWFLVAAFTLAMGWVAFYNNIDKPPLTRWAFAVGTPLVFWVMVAGLFGMIHTFGLVATIGVVVAWAVASWYHRSKWFGWLGAAIVAGFGSVWFF